MPLVAFVRCYDRQEYSRLPFHSRQHAKAGAKSACEKERTAARLNMSVFDASLSVHGLKGMIALHHKITIKKNKMKKVVFAIQVFCLMAAFPVYMILELNYKPVAPHQTNITPVTRMGSSAENEAAVFAPGHLIIFPS
ncbi:MAG TPA: hypothetical protein PLG91_07015 [Ferruginibacter sp.]|nr:hypothetical protein [Ferruginibacter sp.]